MKSIFTGSIYDENNRKQVDLILAFFLSGIHYIITTRGLHKQAVLDFGSSSYYLSQGQSFRAVTALFLHSDTEFAQSLMDWLSF